MKCDIREIRTHNANEVLSLESVVATHLYGCRPIHSAHLSLRDLVLSLSRQAHLSLWASPEETSSEVQKRGISGPTKRTYVLQN